MTEFDVDGFVAAYNASSVTARFWLLYEYSASASLEPQWEPLITLRVIEGIVHVRTGDSAQPLARADIYADWMVID